MGFANRARRSSTLLFERPYYRKNVPDALKQFENKANIEYAADAANIRDMRFRKSNEYNVDYALKNRREDMISQAYAKSDVDPAQAVGIHGRLGLRLSRTGGALSQFGVPKVTRGKVNRAPPSARRAAGAGAGAGAAAVRAWDGRDVPANPNVTVRPRFPIPGAVTPNPPSDRPSSARSPKIPSSGSPEFVEIAERMRRDRGSNKETQQRAGAGAGAATTATDVIRTRRQLRTPGSTRRLGRSQSENDTPINSVDRFRGHGRGSGRSYGTGVGIGRAVPKQLQMNQMPGFTRK
jgi:hypothetical protein